MADLARSDGHGGQSQLGAVSPHAAIPNATPDVALSMAIDDLYDEVGHWADGTPLENQAQADTLARVMTQLRAVVASADDARKAEKRPHDEAGKAVQEKWKPIIAKGERAVEAARRPLTDWLARQEAARLAELEAARIEAERLASEAQSIGGQTLADAEQRDEALDEAGKAARHVAKLEKAAPRASGEGRAVGLRTYYETELTDAAQALAWLRAHRPMELKAAMLDLIDAQTLSIRRTIPGVEIIERKKAA